MKNILFIVVDSVTNDTLFNCSNSKQKAPFLNSLREKSITGDKMYSQAPYTEAALMSLLGSLDTLDYGGYMEKFKNKRTVIDEFNKNGYNTFFSTYYPSIYPSYMHYGAKELNYIETFHFSHLWSYRFEYYANLYLNKSTSPEENSMLEEMLGDNLKAWIELLKLLSEKGPKTELINECIDSSGIENTISQIQAELDKFNANKSEYLMQLFSDGEDHVLFKLPSYDYTDKINNDEFREYIIKNYYDTFQRIYSTQKKLCLKNTRFPWGKLIRNLNNPKCVKGLLAAYKNLVLDKDIFDRVNQNFDLFKAQRSFRTVADLSLDWIERNKNSDTPWMAYIHVDDAHYPENFFTYDTTDKEVVETEFEKINNYLSKLPKDYCGTISADLALLYCDSVIEYIFSSLEKNNLLDNTSVVITADHGFSYYFNPIREKYVISSYKENYNVPFLVYDKNIQHKEIAGFLATKDIPATLLDLAGLEVPSYFKGQSLLDFEGRDYSTLEYMGGGCPDLKRRPVILGVRDDNYEVITEILHDTIEIKEVYDMNKDPFEHHNLSKKKNLNITKQLDIIKNRYYEIMREADTVIE